MRVKNGKKERLWMKVVRSEGGLRVVLNEPVNPDTTLGDLTELETLLNKVYGPAIQFEQQYEWKEVDIVSAAEIHAEDKAKGKTSPPRPTLSDIKAIDTLDNIHAELDGTEWSSDTLEKVAFLIRAAGYKIREPQ